jgi:hypothetical protein
MTTLAEAIAKHLAEGHYGTPCTEPEKEFLRHWANALDTLVWKRISKKDIRPISLVSETLLSLHHAVRDDKFGADGRTHHWPARRQELMDMADKAQALADFYWREGVTVVLTDDDDEQEEQRQLDEGYERLDELREWPLRQAKELREHADMLKQAPPPLVHVSQKTEGRERRLFMQHLSRRMVERFGAWHDLTVAEITSLMYPKAKVSEQAVAKQREKLLKNATPPFPPQES